MLCVDSSKILSILVNVYHWTSIVDFKSRENSSALGNGDVIYYTHSTISFLSYIVLVFGVGLQNNKYSDTVFRSFNIYMLLIFAVQKCTKNATQKFSTRFRIPLNTETDNLTTLQSLCSYIGRPLTYSRYICILCVTCI